MFFYCACSTCLSLYVQVMKLYMNKLTPYEHHEIFNYPQIYFIGANAKKRPGIIGGPNNCGYDDDQVIFASFSNFLSNLNFLRFFFRGFSNFIVQTRQDKGCIKPLVEIIRIKKYYWHWKVVCGCTVKLNFARWYQVDVHKNRFICKTATCKYHCWFFSSFRAG